MPAKTLRAIKPLCSSSPEVEIEAEINTGRSSSLCCCADEELEYGTRLTSALGLAEL